MTTPDLEPIVDRALKTLPPPRAPQTLLPAVMAAVRAAAQRPWYARPWSTWPVRWQVASSAALVLLVGAGLLLGPAMWPMVASAGAIAGDVIGPVRGLVSDTALLMTAMEIAGRTIAQSSIGTGLALLTCWVVVMLATSVAVSAAIGRLALGGAR